MLRLHLLHTFEPFALIGDLHGLFGWLDYYARTDVRENQNGELSFRTKHPP